VCCHYLFASLERNSTRPSSKSTVVVNFLIKERPTIIHLVPGIVLYTANIIPCALAEPTFKYCIRCKSIES
jgi:hypothetical protein